MKAKKKVKLISVNSYIDKPGDLGVPLSKEVEDSLPPEIGNHILEFSTSGDIAYLFTVDIDKLDMSQSGVEFFLKNLSDSFRNLGLHFIILPTRGNVPDLTCYKLYRGKKDD